MRLTKFTHTFKKHKRALVWTAYSRLQKRVIAYHIGEGKSAVKKIYNKVKKLRPNISHIYSDANSCYDVAFNEMNISERHTMTKRETHLIESSNSSIRDNLARFNRRTKGFSNLFSLLKTLLNCFFIKTFYLKQYLFDAPLSDRAEPGPTPLPELKLM